MRIKCVYFLRFFLCCVLLNSCNPVTLDYTIIYSEEEPIGDITKALEKVLERNYNVDIILINNAGAGSLANVDSVASGKADFTITENHVPFKEGVNSVLVFYPQILHVFYKGDHSPASFKELVEGKTIFIGNEGSGSYRFMMDLMGFFDINMDLVTVTENPFDEYDILAGFSDILPNNYLLGLDDFRIYSFDEVTKYQNGSIADAISLKFPRVKPYVIPAKTYGNKTPEAILTISSDAVLVVRSDMRAVPVNDMITTIFKEKEAFVNISPLIFKGMSENFDRSSLNFPLHEGARQYLDRDEPSWFERYAELFGVIFSVIIAVVSGIISLSKWQKQKKKDRVDVFYEVLMNIKKKLPTMNNSKEVSNYIREIQESQNKAFDMLIHEELEANESFRIFMEFSKETIHDLRLKLRALKSKGSD